MMSIRNLHTSIRSAVPPEDLVIGISRELILREASEDLKRLVSLGTLVVDTRYQAVSVRISKVEPEPQPVRFVRDDEIAVSFKAKLEFFSQADDAVYRARRLVVTNAAFRLVPDSTGPTGIRFSYQHSGAAIQVLPSDEGAPAKAPIDAHYGGREQDYLAEEAVLADRVTDAVINVLLTSFYVPALKSAMERFKLGLDLYLEAHHAEFLLLHGRAEVSKNGCPYAPRNDAPPHIFGEMGALPGATPCKELVNNDFRLELVVLYPRSSTFDVLAGGVSLGIQYDDYAYFTTYFWQYNVAAVLTHLEVSFDMAQLKMSLDSTWNLAGSGSVGPRISCVSQNISLVTAGLDQGSSVKVSASAQPCLDDDTVYLKTTRGGTSDIHIHFQNPIAGPTLQSALDAALKGPLNDALSKALADSMQVPLFKLAGWYGQGDRPRYQYWTQSVMADSLLIALPRPYSPTAVDEHKASGNVFP